MSDQDGMKQYILPKPDFTGIDLQERLKQHWKQQGQPWRIEPEIDADRQKYLEERRKITPNHINGIFPFGGIKLSRADVEWLLATHDNGHGPLFWEKDRPVPFPIGLDLRGALLQNVNLRHLPLAYLQGGIYTGDRWTYTNEQRDAMVIHLEGADLQGTHLEQANLIGAHLEIAHLREAHLERAQIGGAHLQDAFLLLTHLEEANLQGANLESASICESSLIGASLKDAKLNGATIARSTLEGVVMSGARLDDAHLSQQNMEGVVFEKASFGRADLRRASFDHTTDFEDARFSDEKGIGPQVGDVHWGDVSLAGVDDWSSVKILKDEYDASIPINSFKSRKGKSTRIKEYQVATRAYRQLVVVLRNQGLNDEANRFAYRAQLMQRIAYRHQRKIGQYLGSWFLDQLSGYGYKPLRSFRTYIIVVLAFAFWYFMIGHSVGPSLTPFGSLVFSVTSFHGRGFFPGGITLDAQLTRVAALEAFVGLLIEVTFIATLTRRLFGG